MRRKILGVLGAVVLLLLIGIGLSWASDKPVSELTARWATAPSVFRPIDGLSVHLRDEGPREDSLPIVLLHGTASSLHTWEGWTEPLRATRRVVRMDLPGFGLTGPDAAGDYSIARYVRFVRATLDSLQLRRVVLIGNSLGGEIAWNVALADSARVAKLVLVDAAGFANGSTSIPIGFRLARIPALRGLLRHVLPRFVVASSVRNVFGHRDKVTAELVDRYFDMTVREGNRDAVFARFQQQPTEDPSVKRLGELRVPTLIMWGSKDGLIPIANAERFKLAIAGSRTATFTGLGHVPHEEDPTTTMRLLLPFLREPLAPAKR